MGCLFCNKLEEDWDLSTFKFGRFGSTVEDRVKDLPVVVFTLLMAEAVVNTAESQAETPTSTEETEETSTDGQ